MPDQSDRPAGSNTLPPSEINPLSSPLLTQNLRRWAEVYFDNPPERRDQAVVELLQQLEAERAERSVGLAVETNRRKPILADTSIEEDPNKVVRCKLCGHDNDRSQRFCGMCGAVFGTDQFQRPQFDRGSNQVWDLQASRSDDQDGPSEPWVEEESSVRYEEPSNTNELSLFQSVPRESDYDGPYWEYGSSPSRPYRFYIGVVLAALLTGLGYMAWRGMQGTKQSHEVSPPPPIVQEEATPPAQPSETAKAQTPAPDAKSAQTPTAGANSTQPASPPSQEAASETEAVKPKDPEHPKPTPAAEVTRVSSSHVETGKGEPELSVAERFLSGTGGGQRDTAEASKWLWRSVAKHNGRATLLLADLYLRGDGVSKNCDQARVLLDSAARKGISGAGERIRNLQAYGCQ